MSEEDWRKNQGLCKHGFKVHACVWCQREVPSQVEIDRAIKTIEDYAKEKVKTDKEEFDLTQIPFGSLKKIGGIFKEGEVKYGRDNWKLGVDDLAYRLERANHAIKHLYQYIAKIMEGKELEGEDDIAKVAWFCVTDMELVRMRLSEGKKNE